MKDNPQLLVYKASAGSGKTFTLAVEYIKHLVRNPYAYRHILAVTFTNKATTEMKERILGQLYGIWTNDKDSASYLHRIKSDLDMPEEEIRKACGKALELMIHDYSRFRVETIDSFFQSVMRNLARELELGTNLNIELDNKTALSEAVDSMFEKLDRNSPVLYWLLDYIEERIQDDKQWNVAWEIKKFGENIFKEEYIEKGKALRKTLEDPNCIKEYRKMLKAIEVEALEQMKGFADQFFGVLEANGLGIDDLSGKSRGIASYFNKLLQGETGNAIRNATVEKHLDLADNWTSKTNKKRNIIIQLANDELIPLLKTAEEFRLKNNPIIHSCQLSLKHVNNVRLLNNIDEEVHQLNHEKNRFLLADTNALLHDIVREGDPSFVFEKIGTSIRNVMIDEFQDTSRMQWSNFKLLLLEGLSQGADSLIVGDVKQSIYRWRSGDWGILNGLKDRIGAFPVKVETLSTNRRSEANIVRFNNEIFPEACKVLNDMHRQEQEEDCHDLLNAYQDVRQEIAKTPEKGSVKVSFLPGNKEDYQEETLDKLKDEVDAMIQQGVKLSEMAILVRKNKLIPMIADYFDKHTSYRIISDEAFQLNASLAICMLMDALRCLVDSQNTIAKAQLAIAYQNEVLKNPTDLNDILLEDTDSYLPVGFLEQMDELRLVPLFELLEKLFALFELSKIEEQDAYLYAFYDAVNDYLQKNSSELTAFLKHWEEKLGTKSIPSGEIEGIRILSIHKSKGLEFHTVLIPFCDWKLENEQHSYIWCSPRQAPYNELDLLPINYVKDMNESIYHDDYVKEKLQLWVDNLNLLYVAFTRPKCNLVVWCKEPSKTGFSNVSDLLAKAIAQTSCEASDNNYLFGEVCPSESKEEKEITNRLLIKPEGVPVKLESQETHIEFKHSNRSADFIKGKESDQSKYIRQGLLYHNLFSCLRTPKDIDPAIGRLRMEGIIGSSEEEEQIRKFTLWALNMPQAKDWFSGDWELYNECDILHWENNAVKTLRPDRVMIKDGKVVIVDFKFGNPNHDYNDKMTMYIDKLTQMGYPDVKGYLWYVFKNEIEEIKVNR